MSRKSNWSIKAQRKDRLQEHPKEAELWQREAIQKGRVEGRVEVAKNLLDLGMEISKIAKATGMTEEEVKELKD
ncbi:Signal transduction histidine kinase [Desulfosporosinus sp. I2]|uniref:hypothetical protein n=1 Tax=Desulfosporosinus sp. I2 TaxID=1617025 RepID=UPI00061F78AC|nr:hypothetical protein [Desulfosporosinus sp. I2]KJR46310.1 Signal transduction histidine kinase [Desulfosporosinus sp. I2]